jgi:hypothetical protein
MYLNKKCIILHNSAHINQRIEVGAIAGPFLDPEAGSRAASFFPSEAGAAHQNNEAFHPFFFFSIRVLVEFSQLPKVSLKGWSHEILIAFL